MLPFLFGMNQPFENIPTGKKIYVASDFHLTGIKSALETKKETQALSWLGSIKSEAAGVILAGDVFDFWFEYKKVVPKGCVRLLGKLAELSDSGIPIIIFKGNHDLWLKDYLADEIGATIYSEPQSFKIGKNKILIGHGDGLGPGDHKFKFLKKVFTAGFNKWLFRWLHPDIGISMGQWWSHQSLKRNEYKPDPFLGEKEPILIWCKEQEAISHHDYYIFGHRHIKSEMSVTENSTYINLGDWLDDGRYIEISQSNVTIKEFEK